MARLKKTHAINSRNIRGPSHMLLGDATQQPVNGHVKRHKHAEIVNQQRTEKNRIPEEIAQGTAEVLQAENERMVEISMLDNGGMQGRMEAEAGGNEADWSDDEDSDEGGGKEYTELFHNTYELLNKLEYRDHRTRKEKIQLDQAQWEPQLDEMTEAFMDWENRAEYDLECDKEAYLIETPTYVDFDGIWATHQFKMYVGDQYKSSSYIQNGAFPCTALVRKFVISTKLLRMYHHLWARCPRLGIQPFIKSLCNIFRLTFNNHYCVQFSVAYDLYLEIGRRIRKRVATALNRAAPNWRMMNTCPCCQYFVRGEMALIIWMLCCMDGNDSLKRVERREVAYAEDGAKLLGSSRERPDDHIGGEEYMLLHGEVDQWDIKKWRDAAHGSEIESSTPCEEKLKNMNDMHMAKSWSIMQGWFVLLCRHGFLLKGADFVRSGEQTKYPLAIMNHFLRGCEEEAKLLGDDALDGILGVGYDLGCKIRSTVMESPLRPLALSQKLMMLVGILHGHAHQRLCQLVFLLIYVLGAGLENLEGCERYFSKSNALAPTTRHASKFHRRQAIKKYA
ncbi:hypothetical protein V5O48_014732 [Marasmius crinis-equi]|uniref:Uncharacterized protein n=1 Tax=Marasmius crinis-equi TaxID=585013 RepID=A0ABR3EWH5_9AGAR